jgi:hypothetical protein
MNNYLGHQRVPLPLKPPSKEEKRKKWEEEWVKERVEKWVKTPETEHLNLLPSQSRCLKCQLAH